MGEAFTLADAAAAPFILRLPMYAKLKQVTLGEGLPKLDAYHKALKARK
jgi:glutathione S-transferase